MAAQSVAPNQRRKPQIETDDVLVARAVEFSHWAKENIRLVVGFAAVLLITGAAVIYWRYYQAERLESAAAEFFTLQQTVASGNAELAMRDLQRFVGRFEGTPYADEARIALGQLHLRQGQPAEAVQALQPLLDDIDDSPVGPQGGLLLASAYEAAGDTEAAVATYLEVADEVELLFLQAEALESAALLRMQAEDYAAAAELYRRLVGLAEEGTLDRSIYEMRLAEAEASIGTAS